MAKNSEVIITFFASDGTHTERSYTGEASALMAELDMDAHIRTGGHCLAEHGNRAVLVSNLSQLAINRSV